MSKSLALAVVALVTQHLMPTTMRAEEPPPFPEYPAFRPGEVPASDQTVYSLFLLEELEAAPLSDEVPASLEGFLRIGDDYDRFWFKADAEVLTTEGEGEAEGQALYSRLIAAYFEAQAGVRLDTAFGDDEFRARPLLVVGLEGIAPYWFEIEPALFVSFEGHLSARLEASYDLLLTQRMILEPEVELNVALQDVDDWGVGRGFNDLELGLRLRYEIVREVAPYLGLSWVRRFGAAADFARAEGESDAETLFVAGLRLWY